LDPFTHVLAGAVGNRAFGPRQPSSMAFSHRERFLLGGAAALFPDSDWVIQLFADELVYLNLHRGITHSLIMLPFWALLLGWLIARFWPQKRDWRDAALIVGISIGIHILLDFITSYGTKLFAPLAGAPLAFPSTFIIDPWITLILLLGALAAWYRPGRLLPRCSLAVLAAFLLFQGSMKLNALEHAREAASDKGFPSAQVHALPQPISPLHWHLIVETVDSQYDARLGFLRRPTSVAEDAGLLRRHWQAFNPPQALIWQEWPRYGRPEQADFAREAWRQPEFEGFREFARLPYLWGVKTRDGQRCAVFHDLRFRIEGLDESPFQFAMCRDEQGDWSRRRMDSW